MILLLFIFCVYINFKYQLIKMKGNVMNRLYKREDQIINRLYDRNDTQETLKEYTIMDILETVPLKFKNLKGVKSAFEKGTIFLDKSFLNEENISMHEIENHLLHQFVRFEQDVSLKENSEKTVGLDELVDGDKYINFLFLALSEVDAYIKEELFYTSDKDIDKALKTRKVNDFTVVFLQKLKEYFTLPNSNYDLSKFSFVGNTHINSHFGIVKDNADAILRSLSNYANIGKLFTYKVNLEEILKTISLDYQQNRIYKFAIDNYIGEGRVNSLNSFLSIIKGKDYKSR